MFVRTGGEKKARRREIDALRDQFAHAIRTAACSLEAAQIEQVFQAAFDATLGTDKQVE